MMAFILAAAGGFAAVTLLGRARRRYGMRGHGPLRFAVRRLGLDRQQRDQVWEIVNDVRRAAADLRGGRWRGLRAAADALAQETFDRARVEAAADVELGTIGRLRVEAIAALERLHAVLTPEQRGRLRDWMDRRRTAHAHL